jgi:hypothetical protein
MMIDVIVEFALYGAVVGAIYKPVVTPTRKPTTV